MAGERIDLERLAFLIRLVESRGLKELIFEENGCRYEIRGFGRPGVEAETPLADEPPGTSEAVYDGRLAVTAPMVGVFYRAPGPGEPPFVEVGDRIERGQTVGVIEAMKVFSEVPSEHEGVVVEIVADDGKLVKPGDVLLYLAAVGEVDEGEHGDH